MSAFYVNTVAYCKEKAHTLAGKQHCPAGQVNLTDGNSSLRSHSVVGLIF